MSDGQRYICKAPRCKQEHRESNHWFLIWTDNVVMQQDVGKKTVEFHLRNFSEEAAKVLSAASFTVKWVCSPACAQRVLESFMSTSRLP